MEDTDIKELNNSEIEDYWKEEWSIYVRRKKNYIKYFTLLIKHSNTRIISNHRSLRKLEEKKNCALNSIVLNFDINKY